MSPAVGRSGTGPMWADAVAFADRALTRLGHTPTLGAEALLRERRSDVPIDEVGPISFGGSARLLPSVGGWIVVNLPRPDDLELLPAWLGVTAADDVPWAAVADAVAACDAYEAAASAQELGLAVAVVPAPDAAPDVQLLARGTVDATRPFLRSSVGVAVGARSLSGLHVVDLSSLWAGPVCARLLLQCGARVTKVESTTRPDGARLGDPKFFDALHAGKEFVSLPFDTEAGIAELRALLASADVVLEASRPRALDRLGIEPHAVVAGRPGAVWISITAYGRTGPWRDRVGFGDDVAAAAGLVDRDPLGRPAFVGDAIADPLAGVVAAVLVHDSMARGGGEHLDLAMREVARAAARGEEVVW